MKKEFSKKIYCQQQALSCKSMQMKYANELCDEVSFEKKFVTFHC